MATAVQIELMVDEKGAVSGVRNFDTAVKGTTGSVRQLDAEMAAVGTRATAAGQKAASGIGLVGKSSMTSREQVRLLSEEIGVHVPRAMQSVISKCPVLASAIGKISGAMIRLSAIQIGAMVFEGAIHGAEKLWDALTALPKAVQDYEAEVAKTKDQEFGNTHSIETTRLRIDEATEAVKRFQQQANENMPESMGWRSWANVLLPGAGSQWQMSHEKNEAATHQMEKQKQLDKLHHNTESSQWHEQMESDITFRHGGDSKLKDAQAQHDATIKEARERAAEERRYANEQDRMLGNPVAADAGADKERQAVAIATQKADAALAAERDKGHGREKSNLSAENRLIHERLEAERELTRLRQQPQLQGMRPVERIQQEGANRIANLSPDLEPINREQQSIEIRRQTNFAANAERQKEADAADEQRLREAEQRQRDADDAQKSLD